MIVVVAGTRPEHIKLAPVIRELRRMGRHVRYLWTGQHSDASLAADVFAATGGPTPDVSVRWPGLRARRGRPSKIDRDHGPALVYENASAVGPALREHIRDAALVVVQGDTASAFAGYREAQRNNVRLAHLEAGLRSYDWTMPEEHVRVDIDREADLLLAPSAACAATCRIERAALAGRCGSSERLGKVVTVGQTGLDSLLEAGLSHEQTGGWLAQARAKLLGYHPKGRIALVTLHRAAIADDPPLLRRTMHGILNACADADFRVVWALHPRIENDRKHAGTAADVVGTDPLDHEPGVLVPPIDYRVMAGLLLTPGAADRLVVLTDSGGLAEDAAFAGVPTVILRPTTERQELLSMPESRVSIVAPSIASETVREGVARGIRLTRGDHVVPRPSGRDYPYMGRKDGVFVPVRPSVLAANEIAAFHDALR